jgi:hypothetical protein
VRELGGWADYRAKSSRKAMLRNQQMPMV